MAKPKRQNLMPTKSEATRASLDYARGFWLGFWNDAWRLRVQIVLVILLVWLRLWGHLLPSSPLTVILMRLTGPCLAAVVGHVFRSQLFPYVNLGEMIGGRGRPPHPDFGLTFVGICIIYAAFIVAGALAFGV